MQLYYLIRTQLEYKNIWTCGFAYCIIMHIVILDFFGETYRRYISKLLIGMMPNFKDTNIIFIK